MKRLALTFTIILGMSLCAFAQEQGAPLSSGAILFIGFGAAYALKKREK